MNLNVLFVSFVGKKKRISLVFIKSIIILWNKYLTCHNCLIIYFLLLNLLFFYFREEVYGNEKGGGGSQPPMMIVFYKKYTSIDPSWHVRYLGEFHFFFQKKYTTCLFLDQVIFQLEIKTEKLKNKIINWIMIEENVHPKNQILNRIKNFKSKYEILTCLN